MTALCALPVGRDARFREVGESVIYARAAWMYRRIHDDPTPIDIAFIGTSHTQSGIDSALVEDGLRAEGVEAHVENFALPHLGRDMHFLIARELLETRPVRTLVVEVQETEPRAPHPAFQRLADVADLMRAPLLVNTGLLDNFARLPLRQATLFLRGLAPSWSGVAPDTYAGPHWDDTLVSYGTTELRTTIHTEADFAQLTRAREAQMRQKLAQAAMLPANLPYRYNEVFLRRLLDMARARNVRVVFLYLPFYGGPPVPADAELYAPYGPTLTPRETLDDVGLWQNVDHLNVYGARFLSAWMAGQLRD